MRFAMFKGEKSVTALVDRLFVIQGRGTQAATREAAAALLKANPQLKDVSKVSAGSLIAIPDSAPPLHPGEQVTAPGPTNFFAAQRAQRALDLLHQRLGEIETMAVEKFKAGMDRLQTPELKTAIRSAAGQSPNLADKLPNIDEVIKDSKQTLKDLQLTQDLREKTLSQMRAALATLAK